MVKKLLATTAILTAITVSYAKEAFKVGVENIDYAPYYSLNNNEYSGFMKDVLDAFAKKHDYNLEYNPLPIARLFRDMISGAIDIKAPDHPYWSAEDKKAGKIIYSDAVVSAKEGVIVLSSKASTIKREDIKVVGTVTGFTPFGILELVNNKTVKIVENANLKGLISQVLNGRIDGAYVEEIVAKNVLKKLGKNGNELQLLPESIMPVDEHPFMISFQAKHEKTRDLFNEFLKTDDVKELLKKHGVYVK